TPPGNRAPQNLIPDPDAPVVGVSWFEANNFCARLSEKLHRRVRLPTEAEWEFAARAGSITRFYTGDSELDLDLVGWYDKNSGGKLHPVGQKRPNYFGLYDMHGNAAEWCSDWYCMDYYGLEDRTDPKGVRYGFRRIARGGSCLSGLPGVTLSCRDMAAPDS